ncbi:hypothetical protein OROGR_031593 [Orobanche gracilis]
MRTLCDVCESAAAILFCAADEAALCRACDDKVSMGCFLLLVIISPSSGRSICVTSSLVDTYELDFPTQAKSHVATSVKMLLIDGSSLCMQCDMIVHVSGKRTHGRYLLLRQRVEFPGDKPGSVDDPGSQRASLGEAKREMSNSLRAKDNSQNHGIFSDRAPSNNMDCNGKVENNLIDLNAIPQRMYGEALNHQNIRMIWLAIIMDPRVWFEMDATKGSLRSNEV